ncbi:MAG TPA: CoA pyrophosphatase [Wenzhouxiangella sp.]
MTDLIKQLSTHLEPIETLAVDQSLGGGFVFGAEAHSRKLTQATSPREAAVLVACLGFDEPAVVFTVRSTQMPHHAGQVALPGGRHHAEEAFPLTTALREAKEEVGLDSDAIQVLGAMGPIDTLTGFRITPVVGWVHQPHELRACDREVQAIFTLPLRHVLDVKNYAAHRVQFSAGGEIKRYRVWSLRGERWPIWGATALILAQLAGINVDEPLT